MTLDVTDGVALITDGSANYKDRSGGWAFVAIDADDGIYTESGWSNDATISQMELTAPTKGLEWLAQEYGPCDVLVYSDSEYVVLGCQDTTRKRNKNKGFWKSLDKAIELHEYVEFMHVKGHSDHLYNEMADQLAGEARRRGLKFSNPTENTVGGFRQGQITSERAALDNAPRSGTQRAKVLEAISNAGAQGMTNDELAVILQSPNGASGTPGKRASELHQGGWIEPLEETRPTRMGSASRVWVLTQEAKEFLQPHTSEQRRYQ